MKYRIYTFLVCAAALIRNVSAEQAFEEMVAMPDGVKLYTYGVRPAQGVKCPIVIQRNPYQKTARVDLKAYLQSQKANLKRGYAYIMQHCRGTGVCDGVWVPYEPERSDGLAFL